MPDNIRDAMIEDITTRLGLEGEDAEWLASYITANHHMYAVLLEQVIAAMIIGAGGQVNGSSGTAVVPRWVGDITKALVEVVHQLDPDSPLTSDYYELDKGPVGEA